MARKSQIAKMKKAQIREITVSFVRHLQREEKVCAICRHKFVETKRNKYCSQSCQNKAFYERHGDELRKQHHEKYWEGMNV